MNGHQRRHRTKGEDPSDNNTVPNSTPPLIYLDSLEEVDSSKQEKHKSQKSPEVKPSHLNTEPDTTVEIDTQTKEPTCTKISIKLTATATRKASSPMKSPPPKKLTDIYSRHNTRPIRSRQPPTMLGERVFTSLVEKIDERPGEHALSQVYTPP